MYPAEPRGLEVVQDRRAAGLELGFAVRQSGQSRPATVGIKCGGGCLLEWQPAATHSFDDFHERIPRHIGEIDGDEARIARGQSTSGRSVNR